MLKEKRDFKWLMISNISFFLLSVSFLLMPLEVISPLVTGSMFWLFLLIGITSQIVLTVRFKKRCSKNKTWHLQKNKIGLLVFGQNLYAKIADVSLVLSIVGLIVAMKLTDGTGYSCYIFLAMVVYTLSMHCILNGKIYFYIFNQSNEDKTA